MLGRAKVSSAQRKHKSHERWRWIRVASDPAVQDVHVSDPWFRSGLHAQVPRQEGDSCVRGCVRSLEGQRGYREAGRIQVWFRSLWPFVWRPTAFTLSHGQLMPTRGEEAPTGLHGSEAQLPLPVPAWRGRPEFLTTAYG